MLNSQTRNDGIYSDKTPTLAFNTACIAQRATLACYELLAQMPK